MKADEQIFYWAHMLDESVHASYYEVYMQQHPEDKEDILVDSMVKQFAQALKRDHIDVKDCVVDGCADEDLIKELQDKIVHRYVWDKIRAQTYAAIISRMVALLQRSNSQKFYESDEIEFDDVSHMISRRTIENCLDIVCHNTNLLEINRKIVFGSDAYSRVFKKYGIPAVPCKGYDMTNNIVMGYSPAAQLYASWCAFSIGHNRTREKYICDSGNGPALLKKVLNDVEYAVDTIDLVVTLNKCLDVVHFRNDLALAFIEGGAQTCALVSNLPDKFVI